MVVILDQDDLGGKIQAYAKGIDDEPVKKNEPLQSISRQETFEEDTNDMKKIMEEILRFLDDIPKRLEKLGMEAMTVKVLYNYVWNKTKHRQKQQKLPVRTKEEILGAVLPLLIELNFKQGKKLYSIGLGLEDLQPAGTFASKPVVSKPPPKPKSPKKDPKPKRPKKDEGQGMMSLFGN